MRVRVNSRGEVVCKVNSEREVPNFMIIHSLYFYMNTVLRFLITFLHIGHSSTLSEHSPQQTRWPQGKNRTPRFSTKHTVQVSASSRAERDIYKVYLLNHDLVVTLLWATVIILCSDK